MALPVKTCAECRTTKHIVEFGKNALAKNGTNWYCKKCAKKRANERHVKISLINWLDKDGDSCARCADTETL